MSKSSARKFASRSCALSVLVSTVLMSFIGYKVACAQPTEPNVVILFADDLGWQDIGCYGGPVRTPALDHLAKEGVRFTDFYAGAAVCSPSRAVLLTGRTNLRCSIYSWISDYDQRIHLPKSEITLAEVLRANGYGTAHFGKWHLGMPTTSQPDKPVPSDHGFDYWFATANNALPSHRNPNNFVRNGERVGELKGFACDLVVDDAIQWLSNRDDRSPFYLNVWFHEPHAPLAAPDNLVDDYGELQDPAAIYSATITNTDQAIERLIKHLHEIAPPENTLIIYASDNGSYRADRVGELRGTKGSNYDGGIRVPGIFYWPKHIVADTVTSVPAGVVDVVPTVCGLLGIELPESHLDGADLTPLLQGETDSIAREQPLFWGLPLSGPAVAIREGRYGMVAYRKGALPKDYEAIQILKDEIEELLREKGIFESETRGSTLDRQMFEGFKDRDAERLRGQFIRLNQFHESWIPGLKRAELHRFELYDLQSDPAQSEELSVRLPVVHHRLKIKLQELADEVMAEAFDWSSDEQPPGESDSSSIGVHRLESTYRSPFDAFLYVNRIPNSPEAEEPHDELAGRILGRLANQEGRVLIKVPPGMNRLAYEGFKIALENGNAPHAGRCFSCHQLPELAKLDATPQVPSLRNQQLTITQLEELTSSDAHRELKLDENDLDRLLAFLHTLKDGSDEEFRDRILNSTVLDTNGDSP